MHDDRYLSFVNPATGEKYGKVQIASPEQVYHARDEMRAAFQDWQKKPVKERARILKKFQAVLIDALDEITEVINKDCGKSRQDALIEVLATVDLLHNYIQKAPQWLRPRSVSRGLYLFKMTHIEYQPYGVVGVIAPWNYPFALAISPVVSALLAGNTVLLKPSEVTAASGVLMESLFQRVPELAPFIRVLHGDASVGAQLVQSAPDYIFLTGSTPTGKAVLRGAADNLTPVACELGGKDSMIVLEDANIEESARWGVWGAYYNTGQTCMSIERVYVVEPVYDLFVDLAVTETKKLKIGYTSDLENDFHVGPITDPRQIKTFQRHLEDAVAKGAQILTGGRVDGMFAEPTVLVNVNHDMLVMRDETFGPIMPIMKVRNQEEAIRLANDSHYGLGASIWSNDLERAKRVADRIEASSVVINDTIAQFGVPMLPFGGIKQSGSGRIHGQEGLLQFTRSYAYAIGMPPRKWDIATILRKPGHYRSGSAVLKLVFGTNLRQRVEPLRDEIKHLKISPRRVATGLGFTSLLMSALFGFIRYSKRKR